MSASLVSGRWSGTLVLSVLVLLQVVPVSAQAKPLDFSQILSSVATNAVGLLFKENEIELLGHYCTLSTRPHFHRWKMYHRATVTCPGWTTAVGRARGFTSPVNAEREATRDMVKKLVENGLVTEEEASHWL
ncbi:hypothetical protein OTU49_001966 [Cherax quadricarinatus]|uniref:Anti-lipopolysaccharide factor n=2 Tax=Cherax quadricarinatus TaxID=27406 RepID=A0AAW0XRX6_CHEQU